MNMRLTCSKLPIYYAREEVVNFRWAIEKSIIDMVQNVKGGNKLVIVNPVFLNHRPRDYIRAPAYS